MKKTKIIETYLDGNLKEAEKLEFNKLLIEDDCLASDITLYKEVNEAILDDEIQDFRVKIFKLIGSSSEKSSRFLFFPKRLLKYPIAASIILLIGISLWKVYSLESPGKIFADYYKTYQPDISIRSINTTTDKIHLACLLYQEGKYESSFGILDAYLLENVDNQTARFYLGMNAIELGKIDLAINELKKIEQDETTPYAVHARWYLAMTYLKSGNPDEAKMYLNSLKIGENYYSEKARKVLKKL
jgi:tetratricopeptide (TPR) repeat protein